MNEQSLKRLDSLTQARRAREGALVLAGNALREAKAEFSRAIRDKAATEVLAELSDAVEREDAGERRAAQAVIAALNAELEAARRMIPWLGREPEPLVGEADVVKLARSLGFQVDQDADEESGDLYWRWLAKMGLADALDGLGQDSEEFGFESELDAARGALVQLTVGLDRLVDGAEFSS